MEGPPALPPPSADSSAPGFKTNNSSDSNNNHELALPTPIFPAACDVLVRVITALRARGHLGGLEIPADVLTEESAPNLFTLMVSAYISDTSNPGWSVVYPIPPPPISTGQNVELIHLYQAVSSRGGFRTVGESKSWEAVAMDVGLDVSVRPEIELMYAEYIAPWEILIRDTKVDQQMVVFNDSAGQSSDMQLVSVTIDPPSAPSARQLMKRKRPAVVDTLSWLRMVAKSPDEPGLLKANSWGHVARAVRLRRQMSANIDCRPLMTSWKTLTETLDWLRNVATCPGDEERVVGEDFGKHFATVVQVRRQMFASDKEHGLPSVEIVWDDKDRTCGRADIPEWTGKPSLQYQDPDELWFLGETILTPEINVELNGGSIGDGRQDDCDCRGFCSINCVRTRVAEKRSVLKHKLGPAFSKLGLDRMGEDVALTWTRAEEMTFNNTIQRNRFSFKLWEKLLANLHYKSREEIVSYYYNVYLLRVKAYQNRRARNIARRGDDPLA